MQSAQINTWTNVIAVLLAILEPVHAYLASTPFSLPTFAICVLTAVVAFFTGKPK